jgi:hypothetical protein
LTGDFPVQDTWPKWRYGPNKQSGVFLSADEVPEGWTDSPADQPDTPPKAPAATGAATPLTRKQIVAELSLRKVPYDSTAPTKGLYDLLVEVIDATS